MNFVITMIFDSYIIFNDYCWFLVEFSYRVKAHLKCAAISQSSRHADCGALRQHVSCHARWRKKFSVVAQHVCRSEITGTCLLRRILFHFLHQICFRRRRLYCYHQMYPARSPPFRLCHRKNEM